MNEKSLNLQCVLVITLPLLLFLQVFLLTVAFGLFHGVVFFPVLLSLCGPDNDNALDNGQVGQTSAAAASVEVAGEDPSSASTATTAIEVSHIGYDWFMINTKFRQNMKSLPMQGLLLIRLDEYNKNYTRTSTATVEAACENPSTDATTAIEVSHIGYN